MKVFSSSDLNFSQVMSIILIM